MSSVETEHVLVVPTSVFHEIGHFQGFCDQPDRYLDVLLSSEHISYRRRGDMEQDPSYKQLIPYVIFRFRDEQGRPQLFQYTRGSGQGESRLHSKRSVGVGGHISSVDAVAGDDPYGEGLRRELDEEVIIDTRCRTKLAGLINDDQTDVGRVHLGVVHVYEVDAPAVRPREADIQSAGFQAVSELVSDLEQFETWSQICLRALFS